MPALKMQKERTAERLFGRRRNSPPHPSRTSVWPGDYPEC
jgi:hypothetical protein